MRVYIVWGREDGSTFSNTEWIVRIKSSRRAAEECINYNTKADNIVYRIQEFTVGD